MTLWDLCIRRPIFTLMLVSTPVVLGLVAYTKLGVDLFPNIDIPIVTVTTTLRGASVEEMESTVTRPIEEIVNTVAGIDELRSTTREGFSQIVIQFVLEKNGAVAAQEVDAKVRSILGQLPLGIDPPVIDRFQIDASPVMTLAISGRRDAREVTELARKRIKEDLESLPGIGAVLLVGGRVRAINVIIDPERLLQYPDLSILDVRDALLRENQELPGGRVDQGPREWTLRTMGRIEDPAAFADLIIANRNGQSIRIKDIGRVEDSYEEPRGLSRLWSWDQYEVLGSSYLGDTAVSLIIQKQSGTNTVAVIERVKKRLAELQHLLPSDLRIEIIRDQSRFIKNSIDEVKIHLVLAAVLVSLTILLFIQDWRTTLIATTAIPTSLIGTFFFMHYLGFTLNNITMLGLILAVGIVVDDAVVVHENIFRHMEEYGRSAWEAASTATREIALAVVATTLSLLVIFVPIAFMEGRVGRFFASFGYVVGFSVLLSLFVSFTLTPMLCARFLKTEGGADSGGESGGPGKSSKSSKSSKSGWIWRLIEGSYTGLLRWSLGHRWVIIVVSVGTLLSTPGLLAIIGKDFLPRDDQSEFEVALRFPEGDALEEVDRLCQQIEARLQQLPGVTHTFTTIGDTTGRVGRGQGDVTQATIYVRLVDLRERSFSQFEVQEQARSLLLDYPTLRSAVQDVAAITASGFRQVLVDLNLRGPDMHKLQKYSEQITTWMRQQEEFVDIDTSLSLTKPELRILPKRERASELGVSIQALASTVSILVGGEPVSKYKERDEQYDVWLRADLRARTEHKIPQLTVRSTREGVGVVRLDNVAQFRREQGPNTIERFSRQRQVVISCNLRGLSVGEAVQRISDYVRSLDLPADYRWEFLGQAKDLAETNNSFIVAFGLSFLFMYMILAAQFESLVHPITILAALPLTIPFALLSLLLVGANLEIYAMFGLFMLFGIVKKNGILQVDYTNVLRRQGLPRDQAILEANRTRLRPILMTTVMLVAAMVPMALGTGPGAASRAGMAKVILGGQVLSLLLTLLLTPVAYSLWDDVEEWFRRRTVEE